LNHILRELSKVIASLSSNVYLTHRNVTALKIISSKLDAAHVYFPMAATYNKNDMFAQPNNEKIWGVVNTASLVKELAPPEKLQKSYTKLVSHIYLAIAMVDVGSQVNPGYLKEIYMAFGGLYYLFASGRARYHAQLDYSAPSDGHFIDAWNMPDRKWIKNIMALTLPSIRYRKTIYVTRQYPEITRDLIMEELKNNTINDIKILPKYIATRENTGILEKGNDKIPIRILSDKPLPFIKTAYNKIKRANPGLMEKLFLGCGYPTNMNRHDNPKHVDPYFDGLVIHVHGGGFISMSADSHESYTRQWAKQLKKPIFSINYRLAPADPFPAALDDCWQAYNWIIDNAEATFGIRPSKVILAGDSAGGNLIMGVTMRAIKWGFRVPDGLMLAYPALNLSDRAFTPSILLSLDDQIIPYSMLKLCFNAYTPKEANPEENPYLSPIIAPDHILRRFPPIRMMSGTKDPLHDDCWRLLYRLRVLEKEARMIVYKGMSHGFLNYDVPEGMKEAKICIEDAAKFIKELFDYEEQKLTFQVSK